MSRYSITPTIKDSNGKQRKATTIVPTFPVTGADTYIETTTPERLDKLAYTFYEDITLWWVIAAANGLGKGTLIVPSNTILRIPEKQDVINILIQANSTR
jgi:hypothetical protein